MKSVSVTAQAAIALSLPFAASSPLLSKRADDDSISSCYDDPRLWMPVADVQIAGDTGTGDIRPGFESAVDRFCEAAAGEKLGSGDTFLSYATEVEHDGGEDGRFYGQLAFVYFEIHNRQGVEHDVDEQGCKDNLKQLSKEGSSCYGPDNEDTRGGTWQVINNKLSYHAKPSRTPPKDNEINTLVTAELSAQEANKGGGPPLSPWPHGVIDTILPVSAHSHNDYEREVPLFTALSTGCISVEADVFSAGDSDVEIGHDGPSSGRTLRKQYIEPLADIIERNGGSVYPAKTDAPSFTILIDFKSEGDETLPGVLSSLDALREKGYLSSVDDGQRVERQVTVVLSGNAPWESIRNDVDPADVFFDARITELDGYSDSDWPYIYYASQKYSDSEDRAAEIAAAHEHDLKVRYWDISEDDWEELMDAGVDRLNADDLANTARLARIA